MVARRKRASSVSGNNGLLNAREGLMKPRLTSRSKVSVEMPKDFAASARVKDKRGKVAPVRNGTEGVSN